ncbi:hypothetical protein, partial [Mesorhizobium sp.]|uniref:hypothetical protein n=1 Tax=Mesorhizobium sp. TaxID=1871066 RepID=UPI0025BD9D31
LPPLPSLRRLGVSAGLDSLHLAERRAAARAEHDRRVAAGYLAPTESGKRQQSRLKISAVEPVKDRHHKDKVRDQPTCKKKPDHNRPTNGGGRKGGLRKFIPWCS